MAPSSPPSEPKASVSIEARPPGFGAFWWRVCATHTITYFVAGVLALYVLDYEHLYSQTELSLLMRPTSSAWVAAGPGLQFIRATLFALVLWPARTLLIERSWLVLWGLFVGLAVLGTAGPAPGSFEGAVYTTLPLSRHLIGLPEVVLQTAAFSFLFVTWCRQPARWMNVASSVAVILIAMMSLFGILAALSA